MPFLQIAAVSQPRTQSMVTPSYVDEIDYPEADDGGGNAKDQNIADAMSGNSLPRTNRRYGAARPGASICLLVFGRSRIVMKVHGESPSRLGGGGS
jgi:hypothetical protein